MSAVPSENNDDESLSDSETSTSSDNNSNDVASVTNENIENQEVISNANSTDCSDSNAESEENSEDEDLEDEEDSDYDEEDSERSEYAPSISCYKEVKANWDDFDFDNISESAEVQEAEIYSKLQMATKMIGFGRKEDAFLHLIELLQHYKFAKYRVDPTNYAIPEILEDSSLIPTIAKAYYTINIHLASLVSNPVPFYIQSICINPSEKLFYDCGKAAIKNNDYSTAINMLKRCGKRRDVIQGLLISYYFTGCILGVISSSEWLLSDCSHNNLAVAILEKIQNYNKYWYNVIEEKFNISKIQVERTSIENVKSTLDDIQKEIDNNKMQKVKNDKFMRIEIQDDLTLQGFIRKLIKILKISEFNYEYSVSKFWFFFKENERDLMDFQDDIQNEENIDISCTNDLTTKDNFLDECKGILNNTVDIVCLVDDLINNVVNNKDALDDIVEVPITQTEELYDINYLKKFQYDSSPFSRKKLRNRRHASVLSDSSEKPFSCSESLKIWMGLNNVSRNESFSEKYYETFTTIKKFSDTSNNDTYYEEPEEEERVEIEEYYKIICDEFSKENAAFSHQIIKHFFLYLADQKNKCIPKRSWILLFRLYESYLNYISDIDTSYSLYKVHMMMAELKNPKAKKICARLFTMNHYELRKDYGNFSKEMKYEFKCLSVRFAWLFSFFWNCEPSLTKKLAQCYLRATIIYDGKEIWSFKDKHHVINARTFIRRADIIMRLFLKNETCRDYEKEHWDDLLEKLIHQVNWMDDKEEEKLGFLSMFFKAYFHKKNYGKMVKAGILMMEIINSIMIKDGLNDQTKNLLTVVWKEIDYLEIDQLTECLSNDELEDLGLSLLKFIDVSTINKDSSLWILCFKVAKILEGELDSKEKIFTIFNEISEHPSDSLPTKSLMVLLTAHVYLSQCGCCTINEGRILRTFLKELRIVLKKNELMKDILSNPNNHPLIKNINSTVYIEIFQSIYCMFSDLPKKNRPKIEDHKDENNTEIVKPDWELASIIIPLILPDKIPMYDDKLKIGSEILDIIINKFAFVINYEENDGDRLRINDEFNIFWRRKAVGILSIDYGNDNLSDLKDWPTLKVSKKNSKKAYLSALSLYILTYFNFQSPTTKSDCIKYGKQFIIAPKIVRLKNLIHSALSMIALSSSFILLQLPLRRIYMEFESHLLPFYMTLACKENDSLIYFDIGSVLHQLRGMFKEILLKLPVSAYYRNKLSGLINVLPKKALKFLEKCREYNDPCETHITWVLDYLCAKVAAKDLSISVELPFKYYYNASVALREEEYYVPTKISKINQMNFEPLEIYYKVHSFSFKRNNELRYLYKKCKDENRIKFFKELKIIYRYIRIFHSHDAVKQTPLPSNEYEDAFKGDNLSIYFLMEDLIEQLEPFNENDFIKISKIIKQLCYDAFLIVLQRFKHYKAICRMAERDYKKGRYNDCFDKVYTHIFGRRRVNVLNHAFENFPFIKSLDIQRIPSLKHHAAKIIDLALELAIKDNNCIHIGHILYSVCVSTLSGSYLFEHDILRYKTTCLNFLENAAKDARNVKDSKVPIDLYNILDAFSKTKFVHETKIIESFKSYIPFDNSAKRGTKKRKSAMNDKILSTKLQKSASVSVENSMNQANNTDMISCLKAIIPK
uniref:TPR_REGION domain-containing protein n=1 Tax=Parastrongyloides trichosuri TaxID=131310 RepID=A0A0N4ZTN0_PARTI